MFDKNIIRKSMSFKQLFNMLINKPKGGGIYADIAEDLINYSKTGRRKVDGFFLSDFVSDNKDVYARSTIYKVAGFMKQIGMIEYSGITGLWHVSNEFGSAGKRVYRWWGEFINPESDKEK